jgi:hypothetical protein
MTLDERISRYLDKCPPAISSQRGHDTLFRVTCTLVHGFALNPDEAMRYLAAYSAKCRPPWSLSELQHKIADALKAPHKKPRGYLIGERSTSKQPSSARGPKPYPVRLKAHNLPSGTVGTLSGSLRTHNVHTRIHNVQSITCEASPASQADTTHQTGKQPSQASQVEPLVSGSSKQRNPDCSDPYELLDPPVSVPGCAIPRPPELEVDDDSWRAVNAAGLADNPLILQALLLFGPGCRVNSTKEAARRKSS